MTYASIDDLKASFSEQELIELTNLDDSDAITINLTKANSVLVQTDNEIHSYISSVVAIPVVDEPIVSILNPYAIDIARYRLESKGQVREEVKERYKMAIEWLKMVSRGEILLGDSSGGVASRFADRVFTRDSVSGYTDPWLRSGI
jgi:phage gp36-like protein